MSYASQAAASGQASDEARLRLVVSDPGGIARGEGWIGAAGGWIGRAAGSELRIDDASRAISSQHLRIEREGDGYVAIDQSLNGTTLNGERLVKGQRRRVAPGDVLVLCGWRVALSAGGPAATGPGPVPPTDAPAGPDATLLRRPAGIDPDPVQARPQAPLPSFGSGEASPPPARPRLDLSLADLVGPGAPPPPLVPPRVPDPGLAHFDALLDVSAPLQNAGPPLAAAPLAEVLAEAPADPAPPQPGLPIPAAELLAAFWRGLGLAPPRATPALMEELGRALHEAWIEAGRVGQPPGSTEEALPPAARAGLRGLRSVLEAPEPPRFADALRSALAEPARREAVLRDAVDQAAGRMAESLSARAVESRLAASVRGGWAWRRHAALWRQFAALEGELREAAEGRFRKELNDRLRNETRRLTWAGPTSP